MSSEQNGYINTAVQASLQALNEYQKIWEAGEERLTRKDVLARLASVSQAINSLTEISGLLGKFYAISKE